MHRRGTEARRSVPRLDRSVESGQKLRPLPKGILYQPLPIF